MSNFLKFTSNMNKEVYVVYFGGNSFQEPVVYSTRELALEFIELYLKDIEENGEYHVRYKSENGESIYYNLENNNGGMIRIGMSKETII